MAAGAENSRQLKETEDRIIQVLSSSEGNILEDETAINVIASSKVLSNEVSSKQAVAEQTERNIDEARSQYVRAATPASLLFFTTSHLAQIESMYQYSLSWVVDIYRYSIQTVRRRLQLLQGLTSPRLSNFDFTSCVHRMCLSSASAKKCVRKCRQRSRRTSQLELMQSTRCSRLSFTRTCADPSSKRISSCSRSLWPAPSLSPSHFPLISHGSRFCLGAAFQAMEDPASPWSGSLTNSGRKSFMCHSSSTSSRVFQVGGMSALPLWVLCPVVPAAASSSVQIVVIQILTKPCGCDVIDSIPSAGNMQANGSKFKHFYDAADLVAEPLPFPWDELSPFDSLIFVRLFRPDKILPAISKYVSAELGSHFLEPQTFDLEQSFAAAAPARPLLFVLSPGSDPMSALLAFADAKGAAVESVSLGQGQGVKAEALIARAATDVRSPLTLPLIFSFLRPIVLALCHWQIYLPIVGELPQA